MAEIHGLPGKGAEKLALGLGSAGLGLRKRAAKAALLRADWFIAAQQPQAGRVLRLAAHYLPVMTEQKDLPCG